MLQTTPNTNAEAQGLATILTANLKTTKSIKEQLTSINNLASLGSDAFKDLVDNASKFDDGIIKASRSLGQSLVMARSLEADFGKVSENILRIGGDMDDVYTIFKNVSSEIGRTVYLSSQMLTNVALLSKVGVSEESMKPFFKLTDAIGGTYEEATQQQMNLVNQAKSYGLNVAQFMTSVSGQLTNINKYGFPNGVKDLAEMVAKSKMLGGNMSTAMSFADKIMGSPEVAMDAAAQLQTLGGSFASLADPMELLYLAQNDVKGLNDKLIEATRGLATFNEESGQFEISASERLRIRKSVEIFGGDVNSVIENATKLAKQEEIIKRLSFAPEFRGLGKEQQDILASYAQISKGGKVTIEGKDITQLGKSGLDAVLAKIQGESSQFKGTTEENIQMIQSNTSSIEQVKIAQELMSKGVTLAAIQTENFATKLDAASDVIGGVMTQLGEIKGDVAKRIVDAMGMAAKAFVLGTATDVSGNKTETPFGKLDEATKTTRMTLQQEKPIEINLNSSFKISSITDAARVTIENMIAEKMAAMGYTVQNTGAEKPYPDARPK
jgi:hypothetical protein